MRNGKYQECLAHIGRVDWQRGIAAAQMCVLELSARFDLSPDIMHYDARVGECSDKGRTVTHWDFAVKQVAKLIKEGKLQAALDLCDEYKRIGGIDPFKLKDAAKREAEVKPNDQ